MIHSRIPTGASSNFFPGFLQKLFRNFSRRFFFLRCVSSEIRPIEPYRISAATPPGVQAEILPGIFQGIPSGIPPDILSDILSGTCSEIRSGIPYEILPGVPYEIWLQVTLEFSIRLFSEIRPVHFAVCFWDSRKEYLEKSYS